MLTRRRFLESGAVVTAAAIIGRTPAHAQAQRFDTPLPMPELHDARAQNRTIHLVAAEGRHAFLPGLPTKTYGFSAPYLGPVLRLRKGDEVQITVENTHDRDRPPQLQGSDWIARHGQWALALGLRREEMRSPTAGELSRSAARCTVLKGAAMLAASGSG